MVTGTSPEATAAAEPDDDPPGECSKDFGFLVLDGMQGSELSCFSFTNNHRASGFEGVYKNSIRLGYFTH